MKPPIEAALIKALALICESQSVTPPPMERVYVPHRDDYGTIRASHSDGRALDIMMDDGSFIQTLASLTQSVEVAIYKEESSKFPLTNREALQTARTPDTLQLSLF